MNHLPPNHPFRAAWFQALPEPAAQELRSLARERQVKAGVRFYETGEALHGFFGILSGFASVHVDDAEMTDTFGHLHGPGIWVGEFSILLGQSLVGITAHTDLRLVQLAKSDFEKVAAKYPEIWKALAMQTGITGRLCIQIARDLLLRDPFERCNATLRRLTLNQPLPCELPITQHDLAEICGLSRGVVSRCLSKMEREGLVQRGYGHITLLREPEESRC